MIALVGILVGTVHRSTIDVLRDINVGVCVESLFDERTVAWVKAESQRYALDECTEGATRFALCIAGWRHSRHARVQGL